MKTFFLVLFSISFISAKAWDAPEVIENACYDGCTEKMEQMYEKFLHLKTPPVNVPGMYSGECFHNSPGLDPETTHYLGLLIDTHEGKLTMSPVLQYFGEDNSMKDWSLAEARKEMSGDWITKGHFKLYPTSLTSHYLDDEGYPALVYWARQDSETREIYFMAYLRGWSTAFCIARPNKNGF